MEFRKMVTITLYPRQQKGHWCIEQSFGLGGRGRGWDDFGEWHWNMYNIIYEMSHQSRFDARYWMLGAGALGRPRGMVWGGRREEDSGWRTHVYLWQITFDIWQNQYNIIKLKNKIKNNIWIQILKWSIFNPSFSQQDTLRESGYNRGCIQGSEGSCLTIKQTQFLDRWVGQWCTGKRDEVVRHNLGRSHQVNQTQAKETRWTSVIFKKYLT